MRPLSFALLLAPAGLAAQATPSDTLDLGVHLGRCTAYYHVLSQSTAFTTRDRRTFATYSDSTRTFTKLLRSLSPQAGEAADSASLNAITSFLTLRTKIPSSYPDPEDTWVHLIQSAYEAGCSFFLANWGRDAPKPPTPEEIEK